VYLCVGLSGCETCLVLRRDDVPIVFENVFLVDSASWSCLLVIILNTMVGENLQVNYCTINFYSASYFVSVMIELALIRNNTVVFRAAPIW
jgi:hypothetical protein